MILILFVTFEAIKYNFWLSRIFNRMQCTVLKKSVMVVFGDLLLN